MRPAKAPSKCSPRVGRWNSPSRTRRSTPLPRVPPRVRHLLPRGYPGKWSTRSNRMRRLRFRSDGAANPKTSRPGSSTSRTQPPLGSPDRFSPSTVALNSPDPRRIVDLGGSWLSVTSVQAEFLDQAGDAVSLGHGTVSVEWIDVVLVRGSKTAQIRHHNVDIVGEQRYDV